jgi:hypothetical protein
VEIVEGRQRVARRMPAEGMAIAGAVAYEPSFLLMAEPFATAPYG